MGGKHSWNRRFRVGGVSFPRGFLSAGVSCGLKAGGKKDLALLLAAERSSLAAAFTTNRVRAAPVELSRAVAGKGFCRAVVVNSGAANAATGSRGMRDAREMTALAAAALGVPPSETAVCSTGRIGTFLPMDKIRGGIEKAAAAIERGGNRFAASAIMTTDTRPKEVALESSGLKVRIGGMAKGAGMIFPALKTQATMLAFITTDAVVAPAALKRILAAAVEETFNRISVDGDTSTNDTVMLLASGASGVRFSSAGTRFRQLREGVTAACRELAKMIASDGEGATRFVEIAVRGAISDSQARRAAAAVANSNLVKCALYGASPNWGRILAALGYSGAAVAPARIAVRLGGIVVVRKGMLADAPAVAVKALLKKKNLLLEISLGLGKGSCRYYTCDFSPAYVELNKD